MRLYALTALSFAAALGVLAPVLFVLVLWLAGPHGGMLPEAFRPTVLLSAWAALVLAPTAVAARVYRYLGRRQVSRNPT